MSIFIQDWLTREDVARRLQDYGVKAADVQARVAALTDDEARALGETSIRCPRAET